jgi:hypothetical protein
MISAVSAIELAMLKFPDLHPSGVFLRDENMRRNVDPEEVQVCLDWIAMELPCTTTGSYQYKHVVESYSGRYISNGAFIAAAVGLGNRYLPCENGDPNLEFSFNLSSHPPSVYPECPETLESAVVAIEASTRRDLRRIRSELQDEYDTMGHSFIVNFDMMKVCDDMFSLFVDQEMIGFLLVRDVFTGNYTPEILNLWPRHRRKKFGADVMQAIERCMWGKTISTRVAGVSGCHDFYTAIGYTLEQKSFSRVVYAIKRIGF